MRTKDDDAATALAMHSVWENPKLGLRKRAAEVSFSNSHLQKIFKLNKVHPFKPKLIHTFIFWWVNLLDKWYWASENPHYRIHCNSQGKCLDEKVNVWCAVLPDQIIGSYFLEETLNHEVYLNLLENFLIPNLDVIPVEQRRKLYFQHDGCSSHSTLLRGWLDEHLPERWIWRYGPIFFPPLSPDLIILDFLWGYLKKKVYGKNLNHSIEDLKEAIINSVKEITPGILRNAYKECKNRDVLKLAEAMWNGCFLINCHLFHIFLSYYYSSAQHI